MLPKTIIVREKTKRERRQEDVTLTLIVGVLASVTGGAFLLVMLMKLIG